MTQRSRIDQLALLVLAVVAVTAMATAGAVPLTATEQTADVRSTAQDQEPISYLSPAESDVEREDYEQTGLDVSAAIAVDMQQLQGNFSKHAYEERKAVSDQTEAIFDQGVARDIANRVVELDEQYQEAVRAYNDGRISTESLLRALVRIQTAAAQQQVFADHVGQQPDALSTEPVMLPKPVEEEIKDTDPTNVYVQSAEDGLVLAIAGETQTRQGVLWSERNRTAPNQWEDIQTVVDEASDLYPWASITSASSATVEVWSVEHREAPTQMTAYLDGGTQEVFYELHFVDSGQLPVAETATNTSQGLAVTVNSTQATGPMEVTVTDAMTGQPVDATVRVDDMTVGSTGTDGSLWVVQSLGEFEVEVTTEDETVTVTGP